MKHQCKFIIFFLCFGFFMCNYKVEAKGDYASVDTRILLVLHPNMINFDYSFGRFRRESVLAKDHREVYAELRRAVEDSNKEREIIVQESKQLNLNKFDLMVELDRINNLLTPEKAQEFNAKKSNLKAALDELNKMPIHKKQTKSIREKIGNLEGEITYINNILKGNLITDSKKQKREIEAIEKKINNIEEQIEINRCKSFELEEKALATIYLTSKETHEKIEKIKNEIKQLIKEIAVDNGFEVVIDASFAHEGMKVKSPNSGLSVSSAAPDSVSANLFQNFINLEVTEEEKASTNFDDEMAEMHVIAGRTMGMQDNLKKYLGFRHYIPKELADFSGGQMFLAGGNDITVYVAGKIFEKYNIPNSSKKQLLQTLKEYMNFEDDPFIRTYDL